jgi:hypothetical protein
MVGDTASGGRENCHVVDEHVFIGALFLNNFFKSGKLSLKIFGVVLEFCMLSYLITRSVL